MDEGKRMEGPSGGDIPVVTVTFDAGGAGLSVNPNPVKPRNTGDGRAAVQFNLHLRSGNTEFFDVRFGNIVLCDRAQTGLGNEEIRQLGDRNWIWSFDYDGDAESHLVAYEIFCVYKPKIISIGQTHSLRQAVGGDPSMLLPPEG